jgi:PrtD family type I secretion system ABC transporter
MTDKRSELGAVLATCRGTFLMAALFSSVINLLMMVPSLYMMQVYDRVLHSHSQATLFMLTLIAVALQGTMSLLEVIRSRILVRIGGRLDQKLGERVLASQFKGSLQRLPCNPGQAIRDFDTVRQFLTGPGIFAFFDAPWIPIFLAVIFLLHPLLGYFALAGGVVLLVLAIANNAVTKKPLEMANKASVSVSGAIDSSMRNAEVIEAMGMLRNFQNRWSAKQGDVLHFQAQAADRAAMVMGLTKYARLLLQTAMLGGGAWLAIHEQISAGCIIAASVLLGRALAPVEQAIGVWKGFVGARVSYRRLSELLEVTSATDVRSNLVRPSGAIAMDAVSMTPPGRDTPSLSNVTFELPAGQVLGLIGPSGAGKSILARLLVGSWSAPGVPAAAPSGSTAPTSRAGPRKPAALLSATFPRMSSCSTARSPRTSAGSGRWTAWRSWRPPSGPTSTISSCGCRRVTTRRSAPAAARCRAASASASVSRAPCSAIRPSSPSTSRTPTWTRTARRP